MINIGLIGGGDRGYYVPYWINQNEHSNLVALAEIDSSRIDRFKENLKEDIHITNDYKDLLNNPDIDAVIVMTPDHMHVEHAVNALKSGKDVFLDKPLAITIDGCDEIMDALEVSDNKLMIGMNMRYMTIYKTMKKIIDEDQIGDIKAIWVRHFVGRGGRFYFQDWHRNSKKTNSLLIQKGSHDFDMIHMLSGSYTKKVSAFGSLDFYNDSTNFNNDGLVQKTDLEIDVEDNNVVIMELENGIKASYLQNHFTPDYSRNYTIIGTKGRIESDDIINEIKVTTRKGQSLSQLSDRTYKIKPSEKIYHDGSDFLIWNAFIDYIKDGIEPEVNIVDGKMCVAVGVKATESLRSGGHLKYLL